LQAKTHRGLRGRVEDGKSGGGLCYGYRVVKKLDERGETNPRRSRDRLKRRQLLRVAFLGSLHLASARARFARALNAEGIAGPDGNLWNDSTIRDT